MQKLQLPLASFPLGARQDFAAAVPPPSACSRSSNSTCHTSQLFPVVGGEPDDPNAESRRTGRQNRVWATRRSSGSLDAPTVRRPVRVFAPLDALEPSLTPSAFTRTHDGCARPGLFLLQVTVRGLPSALACPFPLRLTATSGLGPSLSLKDRRVTWLSLQCAEIWCDGG